MPRHSSAGCSPPSPLQEACERHGSSTSNSSAPLSWRSSDASSRELAEPGGVTIAPCEYAVRRRAGLHGEGLSELIRRGWTWGKRALAFSEGSSTTKAWRESADRSKRKPLAETRTERCAHEMALPCSPMALYASACICAMEPARRMKGPWCAAVSCCATPQSERVRSRSWCGPAATWRCNSIRYNSAELPGRSRIDWRSSESARSTCRAPSAAEASLESLTCRMPSAAWVSACRSVRLSVSCTRSASCRWPSIALASAASCSDSRIIEKARR